MDLAIWPVKPMPSSRRTRKSSVSRCSVKTINFSSRTCGSVRTSRSLSNLDSCPASWTFWASSRSCSTCCRSAISRPARSATTPAGACPRPPRSPPGRPRSPRRRRSWLSEDVARPRVIRLCSVMQLLDGEPAVLDVVDQGVRASRSGARRTAAGRRSSWPAGAGRRSWPAGRPSG